MIPPGSASPRAERPPARLGLRENADQFALLVLINAFVGAVVGVERSVLPLLAEQKFAIASATVTLTFLVGFGLAKATMNLVAGELAERLGRKRVLIAGWLFGAPVPLLLIWAPSWEWVVVANVFLGVNQGLAWSAAVIMKIDLVGPRRRGLAMGLNEFAGYLAVALAALAAGYLAAEYGPESAPYWLAGGAVVAGLGLSVFVVRETSGHAALEDSLASPGEAAAELSTRFTVRFRQASWGDAPLLAANQAGFATNLKDALAWGLLPIFFAVEGLTTRQIGWLAALYPAAWALGQIGAGALSDRLGRRPLIVGGMYVQGGALVAMAGAGGFWPWAGAALLLGLGTAAVYPTLVAHVADRSAPRQRASTVGVYRLWRDLGYVAGGLLVGLAADALGYRGAMLVIAAVLIASGVVAARTLDDPRAAGRPRVPDLPVDLEGAGPRRRGRHPTATRMDLFEGGPS